MTEIEIETAIVIVIDAIKDVLVLEAGVGIENAVENEPVPGVPRNQNLVVESLLYIGMYLHLVSNIFLLYNIKLCKVCSDFN